MMNRRFWWTTGVAAIVFGIIGVAAQEPATTQPSTTSSATAPAATAPPATAPSRTTSSPSASSDKVMMIGCLERAGQASATGASGTAGIAGTAATTAGAEKFVLAKAAMAGSSK